jgi:phosphatidate cytidylyltransferase
MKQRTISAIFFAVIMLGGVFGGAIPFFALFALITAGALREFYGLVFDQEKNHKPLRQLIGTLLGFLPFCFALGQFTGWHFSLAGLWPDLPLELVPLAAITLIIFLLFIVELFLQSKRPFDNIGAYALGLLYIGIPFALLVFIVHPEGEYAPLRVFGLLLLNWANDTFAYLVGSKFGKRPFFLRISPKKTWEGTIGGVICTFLLAMALATVIPDYNRLEWMAIGGVVAFFGTVGDLVESLFKRSINIKDSGSILPGHGGFLDRFDSFIFILPFVWLALSMVR